MSIFRKDKTAEELKGEVREASADVLLDKIMGPKIEAAIQRGRREAIDVYLKPEVEKIMVRVAGFDREYRSKVEALVKVAETIYGTVKTRVESMDGLGQQIRIDGQNIVGTVSTEYSRIQSMAKELIQYADDQIRQIEELGKKAATKVPR